MGVDAFQEAASYGVLHGNTQAYANTGAGTAMAMNTSGQNVANYRATTATSATNLGEPKGT